MAQSPARVRPLGSHGLKTILEGASHAWSLIDSGQVPPRPGSALGSDREDRPFRGRSEASQGLLTLQVLDLLLLPQVFQSVSVSCSPLPADGGLLLPLCGLPRT